MAFDLTQRPFENIVRESFDERAKKLSVKALRTKKDTSLEWKTRGGNLFCLFTPTGRVEITWIGTKKGWYIKDWTIATTIRKAQELLQS